MSQIRERGSTHVYKVNKISKEEMDEMTARCVYEQPPFCSAACPLKLDVRAFMQAASAGDFKKALQLYEKVAPFPLVLSSGCEAPCEGKCRLGELGDAVAVRAVEAAAARFGESSKLGGVFRMKKRKTVAILGADLFTLFLAGELEKKAYPVTVFCEQPDPEGYLRVCAPFLSEKDFVPELKRLKGKDIQFEFNCRPDAAFYEDKKQSFNVLCASMDLTRELFPDAAPIPELMFLEEEKLVCGVCEGVLDTAFGAKKAALTVDRLAQNLDPRNMRGSEGACESKLYTDLSEAKSLRRVPSDEEGYTKEQAVEEAGRCILCHCEECLKSCAYLRHYKKHPGLLSREIYNNTQIIMGDHPLNKAMNACALCGQCSVVCPNGFDMAQVCAAARRNMVSTDKMPLAPHEFALLDMLFSNNEAFLARPQPGFEKCRYVFFPGCQAAAIAPATVKAAYLDLCERLEGGVALVLGCCGAILRPPGRSGRDRRLPELREGAQGLLRLRGARDLGAAARARPSEGSARARTSRRSARFLRRARRRADPEGDPRAGRAARLYARGHALVRRPLSLLRLRRADRLRQPRGRRGADRTVPRAQRRALHLLLHGLPRPLCPAGERVAAHPRAVLRHGRGKPAGYQRKAQKPPGAEKRAPAGGLDGGSDGKEA